LCLALLARKIFFKAGSVELQFLWLKKQLGKKEDRRLPKALWGQLRDGV